MLGRVHAEHPCVRLRRRIVTGTEAAAPSRSSNEGKPG